MDDTIRDGKVVAFHFILRDPQGEVLDDSRARGEPMVYLHGAGNLVRGLEAALTGKAVGEVVRAVVPPELGYGQRHGDPMPVPRSALPADAPVEPGSQFMTRTTDGRPMLLWVTRVEDDQVWLDPHHPLAGATLDYEVTVLGVRASTPEERDLGRAQFGVDDA